MKTEFKFAGFNWPRMVARMACGPKELRKKWAGRKLCGEYFHNPRPEQAGTGKGFYLEDAGAPFTRWKWCDEVADRIGHKGWYADEFGGDKIRGIVVYLPHGKLLAGWSMGKGMASKVDAHVYEEERTAAYAADRMAELAAEAERERQAEYRAEQDAAEAAAQAQAAAAEAAAQAQAEAAGVPSLVHLALNPAGVVAAQFMHARHAADYCTACAFTHVPFNTRNREGAPPPPIGAKHQA